MAIQLSSAQSELQTLRVFSSLSSLPHSPPALLLPSLLLFSSAVCVSQEEAGSLRSERKLLSENVQSLERKADKGAQEKDFLLSKYFPPSPLSSIC
jgi:hypothetical protein